MSSLAPLCTYEYLLFLWLLILLFISSWHMYALKSVFR